MVYAVSFSQPFLQARWNWTWHVRGQVLLKFTEQSNPIFCPNKETVLEMQFPLYSDQDNSLISPQCVWVEYFLGC